MTIVRSQRAFARSKTKVLRQTAYCLVTIGALAATMSAAAAEENAEIANRRASERKSFTDAEIVDGFFKIAFGAEFPMTGAADRIRKYSDPVRVYVDNQARPDRRGQVAAVVSDIRRRIRYLDISIVNERDEANVVVTLVHDRNLSRAIRSIYGVDRARRIQRLLQPQCLSGFRRDEHYRILQSYVIIVADAGDFVFYDCIYEELLQALGPINDDVTVPWSMFNDDVQFGFFGLYDQYILNILYDPRIRPGMTRKEVEALLPEVLPAVRAWVAEVNGLQR